MSDGCAPLVLLVDDDTAVLGALKLQLRREPYGVLATDSPLRALALLEGREVDVLVSDQRMPAMSGSELLRRARLRWPSTVRVLMTGDGHADATGPALRESDLYRVLFKPFEPGDLARTIHDALSLKRRRGTEPHHI